MLHRGGRVGVLCALVVLACAGLAAAQPVVVPAPLRIALVPLDDRPVCLQYPQMLARLAHAEIVAPPDAMLGRFTQPGDTAALAGWLRAQDWTRIDALIVSLDMLAYGGLVASRVHAVDEAAALSRLAVLDDIARAHPSLPIYGSSVIMRLAPTADGTNEAYRESLARWAEIADRPQTDAEREEVARLVSAIPAAALSNYTRARARNRRVNLAAVDRARSRVIDVLVVSQDDARPRGLHLADRAAVERAASHADLAGRVGIQPGADEVSMLLLARAVLTARGLSPSVRTTFSSETARTMVAPFEDRPLHETARFQIVAAGGREARIDDTPDLDLFVFASRHDEGAAQRFSRDITDAVARGERVVVADVDPKGDVQGGAPAFTEALLAARVFPRVYGYASWNTAGNTLGTAIPHGLLSWAGARLATQCTSTTWTALADAQLTFLLHRLVNDYAYQGVRRPALNAELRAAQRNTLALGDEAADVGARLQADLAPRLTAFANAFGPVYVPPAPGPTDVAVQVGAPRDLAVHLPWRRTFEAAITFDAPTTPVTGPARRLPDCAPATP